jgi:hypothetical protein
LAFGRAASEITGRIRGAAKGAAARDLRNARRFMVCSRLPLVYPNGGERRKG